MEHRHHQLLVEYGSTSATTWKGGYVTNNFESYYMDENGNKHINNK
jgi:hypothetical protein